jgi:cell division protein FtsN
MQRKKPFHYKSPGNAVKQSASDPLDWTPSMIVLRQCFNSLFVTIALALVSCAIIDENPKKNPQLGLITTPPTYYTTQKARYLGEKYKNNLDRLVERIVSNSKTANLQFANNIASVGGIGFFTHSATSSVDERFLEIIIGVPETFDSKLDHDAKVHRVFSLYGAELLSILASDADIYQEKQVNGYGLNLSWRNLVADAAGPRISLERSTLYFSKARVRSFLQGDLTQNSLLSEAVIFAVVDDGPMKLVSYRPQELKPDSRRPIQEEPLIAGRIPKREEQSEKSASLRPVPKQSIMSKEEGGDSPRLPSLSNDKSNKPQPLPALTGKPEVRNEANSPGAKPDEVPVASSAPSEPLTRELSAAQIKGDLVAEKQASVDRAVLEPNETEPPYVPPNVDLASLPASPAVPRLADAPKAEVPLEEQPLPQGIQAKTLKGAEIVTLSVPKVLQGFVIQIAFVNPRDARYWAETLERRGFAVSLTETGDSGSMRLRIGNFTGREEAERQLQGLRQDGLKGVVLNLPQAYRPEVHPPAIKESVKILPASQ